MLKVELIVVNVIRASCCVMECYSLDVSMYNAKDISCRQHIVR